jgi:tetratricopeptide (TPR) repeat protein
MVLDGRPWTPDAAIEQEAVALLNFLFTKPLCRTDALDYLRHSPLLRLEVRQRALALADRYQEISDPEQYQRAAWNVLRQQHLNALQYRFALRQAETACRLLPGQSLYQTTLGMAQYRVGEYRKAAETLAQADLLHWATPARLAFQAGQLPQAFLALEHAPALRQAIPASLAFLAMSQHQLGDPKTAQATLARLREVVKDPGWAREADQPPYLREAEQLIESKAPNPKP